MTRNVAGKARLSVLFLLAITLALTPPRTEAVAAPSPNTIRLRLMNINIFYGGDELDLHTGTWCSRPDGCPETLDKVIQAIQAAGPDIVALEEAERNTREVARRLGWYFSERMQIVSRFPLIDPPGGNGVYIFAALSPGKIIALANVHLPADPYGPYIIQDGATLEDVLVLENSLRLPAIQDQLRALPPLAAAGIPVFLAGDFNSPSHLDWTAAVDAVREEVRYPVEWPVGAALARAGFRDSYRVVHPDPVAVPGFTWTPGGPESIADEVHDRIDWVLSMGPASALDSGIVGEVGFRDAAYTVDPYPTDHRGVVTTFELTPGDAPLLVAVEERRVFVGESLSVVFHAAGRRDERIAIVPAGGPASSAVAVRSTGVDTPTDGRVLFSTTTIVPGAYDAVLLDGAGRIMSRSPFWLYAAGTPTTLAMSKDRYVVGEDIPVSWKAAPGMRWDWLAIYSPGETDSTPIATTCNTNNCGGNGRYLVYLYTRSSIEGSGHFGADSLPGWVTWALHPGTYEVRLLLDDGYRSVASSPPFKIGLP